MKKYLMTGMAAVAFAAVMTGCSNAEDVYSEEGAAQVGKESVQKAYETAFINTFGKPASNQQWGFDQDFSKASTRAAINVNGNMWETCPELGPTEDADVTAYVRNLTTFNTQHPSGLVNYYVTQVHCGTDTYTNHDGQSGILGSSKMNHLVIAMQASATIENGALVGDWEHINNFNRGNDTDWKGNTLVTDGGTFDFAYIGSEDSKYHNKWCAVDGASISSEYAGYYYICFDFEQSANATTNAYFRDENGEPRNVSLPGAYANVAEATGVTFVVEYFDWSSGQAVKTGEKEYVFGQTEGCTEWRVDNVVNGNQIVDADNDYTDWIIRLVKAEPKEVNNYDVRIMVEDLNAKAENNEDFDQDSDWDFNDVVFDIEYTSATTCNIHVVCVGGVLPLTVAGQEVHALVGSGLKIVGACNGTIENVACNRSLNGRDIVVMVDKGYGYQEITAKTGEPAAKFAVPAGTPFCAEREHIGKKYSLFTQWVTTGTPSAWYSPNE